MGKKYFVTSDVHSFLDELMASLKEKGFEMYNQDHILCICGDLFDRGTENTRVYEFVKGLKRKFLVKGNHEDLLYNALERGYITRTDALNGTDITILEILGANSINASGYINKIDNKAKIYELMSFIDYMRNYYENGKYIFVHGWVPVNFDGDKPVANERYKYSSDHEWGDTRWYEWHQFYNVGATLKDKTIVCGHRDCSLGRMFDSSREPDSSEIFYGDGMIALDALTVRSGRVNILVIDTDD
jgi:hypothetical protein